jgi:NADPH-dependent ferric siderophore reductase
VTSELPPAPVAPLPGDPFARLEGPLAGATRMRLEVVENRPLTPAMQQVVLTAPELAGFSFRPGQDVMLMVAVADGRPVRRRYTIRALDQAARRLTLGIVRHEDGPGERWVRAAGPGDTVEGIGPRGKIFPVEDADWHLFAGDFSALPAYLTMASSLPPGTPSLLILEVPGPDDEQPPDPVADTTVIWRHRLGRPAGDPTELVDELARVPLPPGRGHAYLAGEAKVVLALRETLAARGMHASQMSPKAYWGRGKANASHGEPPRDDS